MPAIIDCLNSSRKARETMKRLAKIETAHEHSNPDQWPKGMNAVAQKSPCEEIRVIMGQELSLKLS